MEIHFHVPGARRKELAAAIGELTEASVMYKAAPTFAYEVGAFIIDKDGVLSFGDATDAVLVKRLLASLSERGFAYEEPENAGVLTIEVPWDGFTEESIANLEKLIAGKAALIRKAVDGIGCLPVERTETTLKFSWFPYGASADEVDAYTHLVSALCATAKLRKRVIARERPVENEKFAFRVFLLQLGFVGDEYKGARKLLLRNLTGNTAFKSGAAPAKQEDAADE